MNIAELQTIVAKQYKEIKELREAAANDLKRLLWHDGLLFDRDQEADRLRSELASWKESYKSLFDSKASLVDEIDTLRADRDSWAQQADDRVKDCVGYIEENKKLRGWFDTKQTRELVDDNKRIRQLLSTVLTAWLEDADPEELPELVNVARKEAP